MNKTTYIIETRGLTKIYGDGAEVRALDNVHIRIAAGEFVTVRGPSGSGKSTLLNMLGALDRPTQGEVLINGQRLTEIKDLDAFRARTVGFIFQMHNLIPTLTAEENVEVPMMGLRVGRSQRKARTRRLLAMVGLADRADHLPPQLSGGQRQRVAIARALANEPAVILADEPTGNLDSESGGEIIDLMRRLNRETEATIIVVSHDPAVARQTNRVLVLQDGRIVDDHPVGHPFEEDLKEFRDSGLGQALLRGDDEVEAVLETLGPADLRVLRQLLQ
ncbi:MAG: ABC transporter ATP-binding protein [Anaerolineae bacterium]